MSTVIEQITALRSESTSSLIEQQKSLIPHDITDETFHKVSLEYIIDGNRTLVEDNKICLQMNCLPFKPIPEDSLIDMQNIKDAYLNLYTDELINPIALFCNGRFIRWSNLEIISQQGHYYILIDNVRDEYSEFIDAIESDTFVVKLYFIPTNVDYAENGPLEQDRDCLFAFNEEGRLDADNNPFITIYSKNSDLIHKDWIATGTVVNAFDTEVNISYCLDNINFIIYKDNVLYPDAKVSVIGPFLTIDDGSVEGNYTISFYYNGRVHKSHNNIARVDPAVLQPYVQKINAGEEVPDYIMNLLTTFELDYDSSISYDENMLKSAKTIIEYNSDLFNEVYASNSTLDIYRVDGKWVLSHLNTAGYLDIPRRRWHENDGFVIMLVNGELYKYYYTHTYYANRFRVSVQDIVEDDIVEFLFFKDACNHTLDITVNEDDEYTAYATHYRNDGMNIFSNETDSTLFEYPSDGEQCFAVKHKFLTNADGESKITFDNPFYYGKQLKLTYRNQFRYFFYKFSQEDEDKNDIAVDIGTDFIYCPDYSKYMVFLNGRYLGTDQYRLVLPNRDTVPFYKYSIYLTRPIKADDFLEVFYVPILINDIATYDSIETNGEIVVDTSKLTYALTNNTYMIWVNGRKIPADHITNISRNKVMINTDTKSINSVCVTKYIEDNDYLSEIFSNNESLWDKIVSNLSHEEICTLLGIDDITLTNTEDKAFGETYPITSVMWEIIRDFYMCNPSVDITEPFVYDYIDEDTKAAIEGQDSGGNYILDAYNADREDSIREREIP
jgi:hypothetical protein